jgi:hypothetical protein
MWKNKNCKSPLKGGIKGFTLLFEAFALTLLREMREGEGDSGSGWS